MNMNASLKMFDSTYSDTISSFYNKDLVKFSQFFLLCCLWSSYLASKQITYQQSHHWPWSRHGIYQRHLWVLMAIKLAQNQQQWITKSFAETKMRQRWGNTNSCGKRKLVRNITTIHVLADMYWIKTLKWKWSSNKKNESLK